MSSPRRHGLPKKRPGRPAKDEIAAELPELEPIEDDALPMLEPIADEAEDDGPVKVTCATADETGLDQTLTVEVPAMEKKDVPDAVRGPLERAAGRFAATLRHRRVLVRFAGEAMIGSSMKELVAELLKPKRPVKIVLRRGFGDELLFEGTAPQVQLETKADGDNVAITVVTGDLEAIDLPIVLPAELNKLAATAKGKKFTFTFRGTAKPDGATRELISSALRAAGAVRAAIGERVLFDRELADRVKVTASGDEFVVMVTPAGDPSITQEALQMVLPEAAAQFDGKAVRVQFASAGQPADVELCITLVKKGKPSRIALGDGGAATEVVWPNLIEVAAGAETTLRIVANGRPRAGVLAAFRREAAGLAAAKGKAVVVDWPAGFALDAEAESCLLETLGAAPKSIACTIGGDLREPFAPLPVAVSDVADRKQVRLDVDAGKPAELVRAIERRMPAVAAQLRGQSVRVLVAGSAAPSRTLLRTLCGAIEAAGAVRLEVEDHGTVDVLLPPLLAITKGQNGTRIGGVAGGRDVAQQELALQRELDAAELPKGGVFTVSPSTLTDQLVAALVARGAARVRIDGHVPVQVHPALFAAPERKLDKLTLRATPDEDAAITGKQVERELPMLLAGLKDPAKLTVVVVWPGARDARNAPVAAVVQGLVDHKVAKVLVDGGNGKPLQVHPPIETPTSPPIAVVAAAATPAEVAADAAAAAPIAGGALIGVLARKDEAIPPMLVLGIAAGADDVHVNAVRLQLEVHLPRFRGRCVMLVLRANGADAPVRRPDALTAMLTQTVATTAAATMLFRGPDAQGRPHFQVVHSTLRALPTGASFGDPRTPR